MKILAFISCVLMSHFSWASESNHTSQVSSFGGQLELHTFYRLLNEFDIEVMDGVVERNDDWSQNTLKLAIKSTAGLQLFAPYGGLKAVTGGRLNLEGEFTWQLSHGSEITFKNLYLRPTEKKLAIGDLTVLDVVNQNDQVVFFLNNIHAGFNQNNTQLLMQNMDLRISPWLAKKMNRPELSNHIVGQVNLTSNLTIPTNYQAKAFPMGACEAGDNWPPENPDVDVALIAMEEVNYLGDVDADHVIFTPSATLENVGTADVAWWRKFTGTYDPYDNDQHPYLIWNMYREIDNRFEQIGASGVKHAFFSTNTSCACNGGNILYPGCRDKYSVGNNNLSAELGPRDNISVFDGLWQSTGSFFDPNGDGIQENSSSAIGENRMVVAELDFVNESLPYYISSWYVIRDDVNIYNNMGSRQYQINPNGNAWILNGVTAFSQGPASDKYVAPNTFDLIAGTASTRIIQGGEGHLTVAVKVVENKDSTYTYNYMIENHDYDPQVNLISLPLSDTATMDGFVFADTDEDSANDWVVIHNNNRLTLRAQLGNELDWGILYSFSFTTDSAPQAGAVSLTGLENGGSQFSGNVITPLFEDLIYENGFELVN